MEEPQEIRRSCRRRVRPVEFWNFEKPEESTSEAIYNELELTKRSIFQTFSRSYYRTPERNSASAEGKVKLPGAVAKREHGHSELGKSNSVCSSKSRGRKRDLEGKSQEKAGPHAVLSDEDPLQSPRLQRKKRKVGGQEPPGKDGAQSVSSDKNKVCSPKPGRRRGKMGDPEPHEKVGAQSMLSGKDTSCSLKVAGKKRNLVGKEGSETDDGYSTLSEGPASSPRKAGQRRRSGSKELQKQKAESRRAAEVTQEHTNKEQDSNVILPSVNKSNLRESFFNESARQHTGSTSKGKFNLSGKDATQNATAFEQPSFRNVLCSTAIEAPGKGVFKVPRLPPFRKPSGSVLKVSSHYLDPSMVTIPEEEEEQQKEKEHEKHQQEQQQQHKEKQRGEREEEEQVEAMKVPQQSQEKAGDGGVTATRSPRKRTRSEKSSSPRVTRELEGHEKGKDYQGQEDTQTQAALNPRRSSRVRTKPLEFWNFEKMEVERREDGEVRVIHQKQDCNQHIQTRVMDCSVALRSQLGQGITFSDIFLRDTTESTMSSHIKGRPWMPPKKLLKTGSRDGVIHPALSPSQGRRRVNARNLISWSPNGSPSKSPLKRKLFSPSENFYEEPVEEDSRVTKISVRGKTLTVVGRVKFSKLQFVVLEKKDYRCYVGHGLQNKNKNVWITYLFLERGHMVWNTTRKLTVYVMEGYGMLKVLKEEGVAYPLKPKVTVQCQKGSKICLKKDGRCKMVKLHLCWVSSDDVCR